ncbi:uncharacterized protein LOC108912051 [Anoplophora glabripennis]|uniref:uncharacterized protein LOC108912051 n=1 Tax=Anoplophora glabripennis TaxID=217634 RepID=UPI000874FDF7|nr:uncharacterized protein LOC108912051 [Anoplophora glabripennis]
MTDNDHPTNEAEEFEEICKDDITKTVENKLSTSNLVILRYTLEPLIQRIGLLGDHSLLHVSLLDAEGEERNISFFLKFFPKFAAPASFAEGIGAFKKEMFVYELFDIFKTSDISLISSVTPTCYIAQYNKYLILDNLISEGYKTLDKHKTLDYESVLVVLQSLAKLHASSIIYEEKRSAELGEHYRLIDNFEQQLEESFFNDREDFVNAKGVEASIKCVVNEIDIFDFSDKLVSGKSFSKVAKDLCYEIYRLVKPSKKFRNTLCHGDLWATNFLLKYDSKDQSISGCKFVDFQCGRYVPPAQDVLSFLYLNTNRDFRKDNMYKVIGMYYSYLERHLKMAGFNINNIIPFSNFMESCEEQKLFAIVQTAIYFPLILISNDEVEAYFSDRELNEKALFEDRSHLVLAHKDKDESYTKRLKESIQDLRDYCEYI